MGSKVENELPRDEEMEGSESENSNLTEKLEELEEELDEEEDNPHGFVFAHNLDTFRKSKRERIAEQRKELNPEE